MEELENNIWSHTMLPRTLLPEPGYELEQCRKWYQTCINVQNHNYRSNLFTIIIILPNYNLSVHIWAGYLYYFWQCFFLEPCHVLFSLQIMGLTFLWNLDGVWIYLTLSMLRNVDTTCTVGGCLRVLSKHSLCCLATRWKHSQNKVYPPN